MASPISVTCAIGGIRGALHNTTMWSRRYARLCDSQAGIPCMKPRAGARAAKPGRRPVTARPAP